VCIALLALNELGAQDIHFSQIGNSPINLNPGLTGVYGGDMRFVANYRSQWRSVPATFQTISGSVENKFYFHKDKSDPMHTKTLYNKYITGGILFNHDQQGSLELTSVTIGMPISLTLPAGKRLYLTGAVMPAYGHRHFSTNELTVDSQWDGAQFNPALPLNEPQLLNNTMIQYFDFGAGGNLRYQSLKKRHYFDIGVGVHHLNRPRHEFWTTQSNVRLEQRYNFYGMGMVQLNEVVDLFGQASYQKQGGSEEALYGVAGRIHLDTRRYKEFALLIGFNYRDLRPNQTLLVRVDEVSDSWSPYIQLYYRTWMLGFSFDRNFSDFQQATDGRGGYEVSLIYRLYRIKNLRFQSCSML
jgi:type IX secretion system PorP/SprF family membrane protein